MTEWQPIETAPKDGRRILVFEPEFQTGGVVMEASWWDAWNDDESHTGWMPANLDERDGFYLFPTHWMPLPASPSAMGE
jgi:hypothetical protein